LTTIQITRAGDVLPPEEVAALQPTFEQIAPLEAELDAITLEETRRSHETMTDQATIPEHVAERARRAVTRMPEVGRQG
jgi:hypothetical protein